MFTTIDKALTAAAMAILFLLTSHGVTVPEFINEDWISGAVAIITPLLVWWIPNKEKSE